MNRSKSCALCFCLLLAKVAAPTPSPAQEPVRARFLNEGPKGWKALRTTALQLEGTFVGKYKLGVHPLVIEESKFKVNGAFLVYEETRTNLEGKVARVIALGVNSKYRFALHQPRPQSSWALADHGSASDPMHVDHPYSRASSLGFVRFLNSPFSVNCLPIPEMISEAGFKLGKVDEVTRDGKKLAKIEFTYAPPKVIPELVKGKPVRRHIHMTKMRGGWMLLDPERNWSLQECSLDLEGGEKNTCVVEYANSDGGPLLPWRVIEKDNAVSAWEVTFSNLRIRDIPEEEFTLTAFGLPEPHGVVWPQPTRWWLWIFLSAVAAAVAAFLVLRMRRRYFASKSVKAEQKAP
jgi:hypothetical protein